MSPSLKRAPSTNDGHLWADYFELVCLLDEEGRLSRGDVEEHTEQLTDIDSDGIQAESPVGASAAELVDGRKLAVADLFRHLRYREQTFDSAYPFRLASGARALELAPPDADSRDARFLYVLLLIASALEHLNGVHSEAVAAAFEGVAHDTIRKWIGPPGEVRHFGTRPTNRPGFSGTLKQKVTDLAGVLGEQAVDKPRLYRDGNNGDGGLDVVAWLPFADKARAALALFVQATCRHDWVEKPGELRYPKWKQKMTLLAEPPSVLVIPYCFRSPDGDWYVDSDITCVTMDRQRIMSLLTDPQIQLERQVVTLVESFGARALATN